MRTVNVEQKSEAWKAHRNKTRNASDAPAVMGVSKHVKRSDLIMQRATGIEREHDKATQRRFDKGNEVEPLLRAYAEKVIGEDLFPVVGVSDDGYLGASFDGLNMAETIIFEGKQFNQAKLEEMANGQIPDEDYWQVIQQFAVCETAKKCIYVVGDGTEEQTRHIIIECEGISEEIQSLRAGWAQLDADVAAYQPTAPAPAAIVVQSETLPAVSVNVNGSIQIASNLPDFGDALKNFIGRIDKAPSTDQGFAEAEAAIKTLDKAQQALEAAKASGLAQVSTVDEMVRTVDSLAELARSTRLALEKMVKARKEAIRAEVITAADAAFDAHIRGINERLGKVQLPVIQRNFIGAIKGLKTLASVREAIDTELARLKIEASALADKIDGNLRSLRDLAKNHAFLFHDAQQLVLKDNSDLVNLIKSRISDHEADLARRKAVEDAQQAAVPQSAPAVATPKPEPGAAPTPAKSAAKVKLGDINAMIAPLSITADGLAQLGFQSIGMERAAKLYSSADVPLMLAMMIQRLQNATFPKQTPDAKGKRKEVAPIVFPAATAKKSEWVKAVEEVPADRLVEFEEHAFTLNLSDEVMNAISDKVNDRVYGGSK